MSSVELAVNGVLYTGWKSARITRTIESLAGSFDLSVNDRWLGQSVSWPVYEEDDCSIRIDGETVITGVVDSRSVEFSPDGVDMSFVGRDSSATLVDCSAVLDRWSFRNASAIDIIEKVAAPFSIPIKVQAGLSLGKLKKIVINPGDTAFTVIATVAKDAGVMVVSDGVGGIIITRADEFTRASEALVEGENLISGRANFNTSGRYSRYVVATQATGNAGSGTRIKGEATDSEILRTNRTLMIRSGKSIDKAGAKRLADWEAQIRAARADSVSVTVKGWRQRNGKLWPINALVPVQSPTLGIYGDMRISIATHTADVKAGELTQLKLVRPDAFTPSPSQNVRAYMSKKGRV